MLDLIASSFPRIMAALRHQGLRRADAAQLILAARYGERATAWSAADCGRARAMIRTAFVNRAPRVRLSVEG